MGLILEVMQVVAPVFVLAGIGFAWARSGLAYDVAFVTRLSMTLATPCLIFSALVEADLDAGALGGLALATLAAYGALAVLVVLLTALAGLDRRTWLAPLIFGNTGNIGLPIALFAFGEAGLGLAVVVFAIMAVMQFTVGVWLVAGGGSVVPALREPMNWA
ncbi:MAG: AEC family transporter, partial [Pseudomonadota bacterium]